MHAVVAVFSLVSSVWKTDYRVDFMEIEFFSKLLTLEVAQRGIVRSNIFVAI